MPHPTQAPEPRSASSFVQGLALGDELLLSAAERAHDLGAEALPWAAAQLLTTLVTAAAPTSVLEIGAGAGVSSAAIARALDPAAAMTLIDPDSEYLRTAKENIAAAGFPVHRVRSIASPAQSVLARFSTSGYDFVFVDADPADYLQIVESSMRLVRPGGMLVIHNIPGEEPLSGDPRGAGTGTDAAPRTDTDSSVRAARLMLIEDTRFTSSLVPVGQGILMAAKKLRHY